MTGNLTIKFATDKTKKQPFKHNKPHLKQNLLTCSVKNIEYSQTIHKSIIINLDKVREVFPWGSNSFSLRMRGYEDQILPIARDKTRILKQHLMGQ